MRPPYAGHYTPGAAPEATSCARCARLVRARQSIWFDGRAPGAVVCGVCVNADPAMHQRTPPPAVDEPHPDQQMIELP